MNLEKKSVDFRFFVFDFFSRPKVFSIPIYHADEEFNGPETLSRRYREILISTKNREFGP
jgi:hypothetical protein